MHSPENYVRVPREVLERAREAIYDAQRYGAGNWQFLLEQIEDALRSYGVPAVDERKPE